MYFRILWIFCHWIEGSRTKSEVAEKLFLLKWSWVSITQVWHMVVIWNSIEEDFTRVFLERNAQTWGKSIKLSFVAPTYTQPLYTSFLMKFNPNFHLRVERNLTKNERKTLIHSLYSLPLTIAKSLRGDQFILTHHYLCIMRVDWSYGKSLEHTHIMPWRLESTIDLIVRLKKGLTKSVASKSSKGLST